MTDRDPDTQFQVGERVLYASEGIVTTISGYNWTESLGGPPSLVSYKLACGISVPHGALRKQTQPAQWPERQPRDCGN